MVGSTRGSGWPEMELRPIPPVEEILGPSPGQILRRRIFGHKGFMIGGIALAVIIFFALLAPVISPHDPYAQSLTTRLSKPFWQVEGRWSHPLGTDHVGRDYLSRLLYGARISLLIGFCVALISGVIGTALGVVAGFFGGRVDMVITFIITLRLSIPFVLVAVAVVGMVGGSLKVVIIVLGLLLWNRYAVVMRSATQQIRNQDYVPAAEAVGCSTPRILLSEIMPNIVNSLVVVATLEMANAILLEAALSFLGMGVPPPMPSWGLMVSEGKDFLFFEPWLITIPGIALFVLVLAINLLGDGIRDVTAPENR
jgi:peptide/nickel transport system permease protein